MTTLFTVLLALALAFGGVGATAHAAQGSLPTDSLYPVKLFLEDARLALTTDPQAELDLLVILASQRAAEMAALAGEGQPVPSQVALRLREHLQLALARAAELDDPALLAALEQIRLMTETQLQVMQQIRQGEPAQADDALRQAEQTLTQTRTMAEGGLADPITFRLRLGTNRPETAPDQPAVTPPAIGDGTPEPDGFGPGDGTCDDCTPQATPFGPNGPGNGPNGQGGLP